ncbi:MAG: HlyD family type I secretion periplasmic adaptor subunit [Burkholderiales bacterium]|jgi:hemolysin D|nr:HlyD family type I secretion periplasmic adaptor subunit [Burkholderiales bacterium]
MTKIELWLDGLISLFKRYRFVWRVAWAHRHEMEPRGLLAHEAQFLPAALSLQETPVSPLPRVAMWLIIAFAGIAFLWAVFGRIDVVATASGKIIPNERTKVIQSLEPAIVKAIYVNDGQQVRAGQVLIELDASQVDADVTRLTGNAAAASLQVARSRAMLASLDAKKQIAVEHPAGVSDAEFAESARFFEGQYGEYLAKLSRLDADIERRLAESKSVQENVRRLQRTIPITKKRVEDLRELEREHYVPRHTLMEREQELIDQEGELAVQRGRLNESEAAIQEARKQAEELTAGMRRTSLDSLNEGLQKLSDYGQELSKAKTRSNQMSLKAPVDGVVQQLAVFTVGGVVTSAQPLMVVVPNDESLEVEAFLENRDVGFVKEGQEAEVKVEAYQYTKYGVIHGEVIFVSHDAINDEKRGLIYAVRVRMEKSTIRIGDQDLRLTPGMSVIAEIKTDKRRVIEYFLTPLMQYKNESFKEQ